MIAMGVSQCSEDIWRQWQNSEMQMETNFHEGVELRFASAYDNSERQSQQIDSLVESGIDLLIVAPNQLSSVSPAIQPTLVCISSHRPCLRQRHSGYCV